MIVVIGISHEIRYTNSMDFTIARDIDDYGLKLFHTPAEKIFVYGKISDVSLNMKM